MSSLLHALLQKDPETVLFTRTNGDITVGQVRRAAARLVSELSTDAPRIHVHTRSLSAFSASLIAAAVLKRPLIVLPQAGSGYLASLGVAPDSFVSDASPDGIKVSIPSGTGDATFDVASAHSPDLVFFTSGSTGTAKEIAKPLAAIEREAEFWQTWLGGRVNHVTGSVSHQHIYGLIFRLALPVISEMTSRDEAALTWEAIASEFTPQTLLVSGPAHLSRLPEFPIVASTLPPVILSSGGPLLPADSNRAANMFGTVPTEILGSTETGGVAWRQNSDGDELWTPLDSVSVSTNDEGRLCISSDFIQTERLPMGDTAEIAPDGRFRLKARADRIAKIEGKRVSLVRVEQTLLGHPDIADIAIVVTRQSDRDRLSALVVLTREGSQRLGDIGAFRMSRALLADFAETLEPAERPKRWRFVGEIPVNAQSKRIQAHLAQVFEGPRLLDVINPTDKRVEGFTAEIDFMAAIELPWFDGHFPGQPILPGLSQVHIATRLAENIWGVAPASMKVSRLKFHRVTQPGEAIHLTLSFNPDSQRISFKFRFGDTLVSTGTIG